jgi:3-hydroxyisobutyrate dehydrogenase-like beta-hydroxyacid dehydrogenase
MMWSNRYWAVDAHAGFLIDDQGLASFSVRCCGRHASVDLIAKDLRLAVAMARAMGIEPQIGAIALNLDTQAQAEGYGTEDAAAVFKLLRP